jgi:hypothetical protein
MSLTFPVGGGGDFRNVPAGSHAAVCDLVAVLGLQPGSAQFPKPKVKIYVRWQVPSERTEDDKPMVIGANLTASMNEKAQLRKLLEGWRGKGFTDEEAAGFDVASVLGKACMISVVEADSGGKIYANVKSVGKLPKGMPVPESESDVILFRNDNSKSDEAAFAKLPKWIQDKIIAQIEPEPVTVSAKAADTSGFDDETIPF